MALTVKMLRDAVETLRKSVPPLSPTRHPVAFLDGDRERPCVWHEPPPEAAAMGPYYLLRPAPDALQSLREDPEFEAGIAAGDFAVIAGGEVIIRAAQKRPVTFADLRAARLAWTPEDLHRGVGWRAALIRHLGFNPYPETTR